MTNPDTELLGQELIEPGLTALEELHRQYQAAYQAYMALLEALPVWRNREQQERLNAAAEACDQAKFRYDMAEMRSWNRGDAA